MSKTREKVARAFFPRTVENAERDRGLARGVLAGILDAASIPGRGYAALWNRYNEPMLEGMARTAADPSNSLALSVAEGIARDPLILLSAPVGGLAGSGGRALASGAGSALLRRVAPVAADAAANAGLSALSQYGTEGRVDLGALATNAGLGLGMQGMGSAVAKMAPKGRAAIMENPNFRKWFGDSKVVNDAGNPLTVYHGTDQSFDSFDPELLGKLTGAESAKKGFFFTDNPENAGFYAGWTPSKEGYEYVTNLIANKKAELGDLENQLSQLKRGENAKLRRVDRESLLSDSELINSGYSAEEIKSLRNNEWNYSPEELSRDAQVRDVMRKIKATEEGLDAAQTLATANSMGRDFKTGMNPNIMPVNLGLKNPLIHEQAGDFRDIKYSDLLDQAKASGKDGLIIKGTRDPLRGNVYVAFDPTQIKSATGNRGTFDPSDPNITHFAGGQSPIVGANTLGGRYIREVAKGEKKEGDEMSGEDLGADWGIDAEPSAPASRRPPEDWKASARPKGTARPVSNVPTWQEAIFPSLSRSSGNPMQDIGAFGAGLKDLAALPVNALAGLVNTLNTPINKGEAFRRGAAGAEPGAMSQNQRAVASLGLLPGYAAGRLASAVIPASTAAAPLARGLANLGRAGAVGAAESTPASLAQFAMGDNAGAIGGLALGGTLGSGVKAAGMGLRSLGKTTGNVAESMTGIPASDLRKIGFLGNSEYGQKVLAVAENRRQHLNDLGDAFLDRVRNFDQYLPNAGQIDQIVENLPPVEGKRIIEAFEKAKPKIKATPESAAAIAKIDDLSAIAAGLMDESGKIPATMVRKIRQEYDQVIGDAFGKESSAYVNALKNGRHEIAKALEEAATESGKPEYVAAMKDYTTKLGALDDVMRKLGGDKKTQEDRIEGYLSNLFQGNKTNQQEAFKRLSDIMGADFAEKAQLLSDAKRIAPTGAIPLISAHKTGKAGLGGGVLGVGYGVASGNPVLAGTSLLGAALGSPALSPGLISVADRVSSMAARPMAGRLARTAGRTGRALLQAETTER